MENGTASTLRKFENKFLTLKECTVLSIHQKYDEELRNSITEKRDPSNSAPHGRPLMLGKLYLMVQENYLWLYSLRHFLLFNTMM